MTKEAKKVLGLALRLVPKEREDLAGELLSSLSGEVDPEIEAAWDAEIKRRVEAIESGKVKGIPWSEVRRKLKSRLRARRRR